MEAMAMAAPLEGITLDGDLSDLRLVF